MQNAHHKASGGSGRPYHIFRLAGEETHILSSEECVGQAPGKIPFLVLLIANQYSLDIVIRIQPELDHKASPAQAISGSWCRQGNHCTVFSDQGQWTSETAGRVFAHSRHPVGKGCHCPALIRFQIFDFDPAPRTLPIPTLVKSLCAELRFISSGDLL